MTIPAYGTWDVEFDGVKPFTGGIITVAPDPLDGTVAGGVWSVDAGSNAAGETLGMSAPMLSCWVESQSLVSPVFGSPTTDYNSGVVLSDNVANLAYAFWDETNFYTVDDTFTTSVLFAADFTAFHEILVVLDGTFVRVYLDGASAGATPALTAFGAYPFATYNIQAQSTTNVRGLALSTSVIAPAGGGPPPTDMAAQMHLGKTGLVIDFDDAAHYDTQLDAATVLHHNNVGRGL